MIDRSNIVHAILLADRGYEGYNALAHIQEKGWKFLFRIKDSACGIAAGLTLPDSDAFDIAFSLKLSNKKSNEAKMLYKNSNHYKLIPNGGSFDFLPSTSRKADPMLFYELSVTSSTRLACPLFIPKKWSTSSRKFSQGLPCTTLLNVSPLAQSSAPAAKSIPTKSTFPPPYMFAANFSVEMCIHPMLKPCLRGLFPLSDPIEKERVSSPRKALSASSTE